MSKPTDRREPSPCDREALAAFAAGALDAPARRAVAEHLERCAACKRTLGWLRSVDRLVGLPVEGHPPAADIVRLVDGEMSAEQRERLRQHLDGCAECRGLEAAARAALGEADRIEQSLRWQQRQRAEAGGEGAGFDVPPLHLLARIPLPSALPRATAADDSAVEAPVPEDRQVLAAEAGLFRLVYYRLGARGQAALFASKEQPLQVLACTLDEEPLSPAETAEDATVFDLGPVAELAGRTLALRLKAGASERSLCWSFIGA